MSMGIISVQHNMSALFTNRQLKITNGSIGKTTEKLASGYRINRSADDAAGLAISEKMRKQIRGLTQASANLQDGVSLSQVADGALNEVHDMVHRINELAIKAANGVLSSDDREYINKEVKALKREISRVFKTTKFNEVEIFRTAEMIYNPDVEGYPTDIGLFHKGNGVLAGLEFNNVRYSISELQALGFKIDANGIATEDFTAEFNLWDGEHVKISMQSGGRLDSAVRNYSWEAREKGMYINGVLSAEWSEMKVDGVKGKATGKGTFPSGEYTFTHRGMTITFEADTELSLAEMTERINGTEDIPSATWDVSVSPSPSVQSADIHDNTATHSIRVTEANKSYIDHSFYLVADANGLAVRDSDSGTKTAYVSWNTFKDSELASIKDENGNNISTNGGYPIVDWDGSAANTEAGITFDKGATYHFESPDPNVKIKFDFSLAESAGLDEVIAALNNVRLSNRSVSVSGTTRATSDSNGTLSIRSASINSSFSIQRAYGRNFDQSNATLEGSITVKRSTIDGQPTEADRPDATGGYSDGTHSVTRTLADRTRDSINSSTPAVPVGVAIQAETYTAYVLDENGDKIQETDINGDPLEDANGDPVYKTEEKVRWHYFEEYDVDYTEVYTNTYDATDSWSRKVNYTFDGTFAGKDMNDVTRTVTENYQRDLIQTQKETYTYTRKLIKEVDYNDLNSYVKAAIESDSRFGGDTASAVSDSFTVDAGGSTISFTVNQTTNYDTGVLSGNGSISNQNTTYADIVTSESNVGATEFAGLASGNITNIAFRDSDSRNPFNFNFSVNKNQAEALTRTSAAVSAGTVKFTATGYGSRTFNPNETAHSINDEQFNNVNVNYVILDVPPRSLIIQSGADSNDQIEMTWYPLNLWSLDLYTTKLTTEEGALAAIDSCAKALQVISGVREKFGAYQNRFEHAIKMTDNTVENTTHSESVIRDTDMAKEMVRFSNAKIIAQAGESMLASANQSKNVVLALLNS